mmetsp:Transcript_62312/g.103609  ORF Transcript_62312/g.103609 Transcript_62312/m.103609 type:complete len:590 (+) Transcript_62312:58-1827(+)
MKDVIFITLLCISLATSAFCSACPAQMHEDDLQDFLSLLQKRTTNHQSHTREQINAQQAEDKASAQEEHEEVEQADAKQPKEEASAQEEEVVEQADAEQPNDETSPKEEMEARVRGLQRRRTSRVKQAEGAEGAEEKLGKWPEREVEEGRPKVSSDAMQGVLILGGMGFIMAIFYLVNSTSVLMRFTAWTMVCETTGILVAVLIYNLKHKLLKGLFQMDKGGIEDEGSEEALIPDMADILLFFQMAIMWWALISTLLFFRSHSLLHLKAYGTIGGHILGFAFVNAWGSLISASSFQGRYLMVFVILCAYVVVTQLLIHIKSKILKALISHFAERNKAVLTMWHEQAYETAKDSSCLGASYLLVMWIRHLVSGRPVPLREQLFDHPNSEISQMAWIGLGLLLLAAALKKLQHFPDDKAWSWGVFAHACISDSSMTSAMAAGWVFLFAMHWSAFDSFGNSPSADTVVALLMSLLAIVTVFVCYVLRHAFDATRAMLKGPLLGVAMGVGFSWEKVFDSSVENLALLEGAGTRTIVMSQGMLILVVFPAWMLYMLPNDNEELSESMSEHLKKGPLPISALWNDDSLYNAVDSK